LRSNTSGINIAEPRLEAAASGDAMNRHSGRSRASARAVITSAALWVFSPSSGALAQESAVPTANAAGSEVAAEAAPEPRSARERRRAARAQTESPPAKTASGAEAPPAVAQADADAADTGSESTESQLICKSVKPLGTRMAKRVCGTPEQWAAIEGRTSEAAGESMRQVHQQSGVIAAQPGPAAGPTP